jgi:hypothetical protein
MRMWPRQRTVVYVNPWSVLGGLEPSERQKREQTFLDLFQLAVQTEDDREEAWAFGKLRELYFESFVDDRMPGFFDAMRWAAQATGGPA